MRAQPPIGSINTSQLTVLCELLSPSMLDLAPAEPGTWDHHRGRTRVQRLKTTNPFRRQSPAPSSAKPSASMGELEKLREQLQEAHRLHEEEQRRREAAEGRALKEKHQREEEQRRREEAEKQTHRDH
ncbi:hypothetical protein G7046_g8335 [Stylonectria norvegica]|nr:hypothetical protein G7046_g8335 [Stylonectria norvegica]